MKERKSRRSKQSVKKNEKDVTKDKQNSNSEPQWVKDTNDDSETSEKEDRESRQKKSQRKSSRNIARKSMAESSGSEDDGESEPDKKSKTGKSKKETVSEDEMNGEKEQTSKQRRNQRKINKRTEKQSEDEGEKESEDDDDKPLVSSVKKGVKRKLPSRAQEGKKSKINEDGKDGDLEADQEQIETPLKSKKTENKKRKGKEHKKADKLKDTEEKEDEEEAGPEEYEVEKLVDIYFKRNGSKEFLVRWKGYSSKHDTWEPEKHLNCKELIDAFLEKCEKAKSIPQREMRAERRKTERYVIRGDQRGRKLSARLKHKPMKTYFDGD